MTTLLLIRHGQASFGSGDYDRLCEPGVLQSRRLGERLRREGRLPGTAVAGTLRRQLDTAAHALDAAGHPLAVAADARFDEYPSDALFAAYLPRVAERSLDAAATVADLRADRRRFQRALAAVMELWVAGHGGFDGESWADFRGRIRDGLDAVVAGCGKDDTVAVFTSGGVIGVAVADVLAAPAEAAVTLSWRVFNASITEIGFGRSGYSLLGFNDVAHLRGAGDGMLTHR